MCLQVNPKILQARWSPDAPKLLAGSLDSHSSAAVMLPLSCFPAFFHNEWEQANCADRVSPTRYARSH
jgi:hypothetical protein